MTTWTRDRTSAANGRAPRRPALSPDNGDIPPDGAAAGATASSVVGLFGLFTATVLYGSVQAGWWGGSGTQTLIFPFLVVFGGLAELIACVWAARARDVLGAAVFGVWGGFWLAFGLYQLLLVTTRRLPLITPGKGFAFDFGMWFVPLAAITATAALAAVATSLGLVAVLTSLTGASVLAAVGFTATQRWALTGSGWLFVVAAAGAWYLASALLLESQHRRPVLPTGRRRS